MSQEGGGAVVLTAIWKGYNDFDKRGYKYSTTIFPAAVILHVLECYELLGMKILKIPIRS